MSDGAGSDPAIDRRMLRTAGGPGSETRFRQWVLLDGNRWLVAGAIAMATFLALLALGSLDPSSLPQALRRADPVETAFAALSTAIVTGVTLVVTIDQLVLSQQLGPLGEHRDRLDDSIEFRREVEDALGGASPAEPAALLSALIDVSDRHVDALANAVDGADEEVVTEVERFVADHRTDAEAVSDRLDSERYLRFGALRAVLDYHYTWRVHEALRLRRQFGDDLDEAGREALDGVVRTLRLFGPAREHVRGLYFQSELVKLSRVILTVAVPALIVSLSMVLYLDRGDVTGATLGVDHLVAVVSAAATVGVLPFFILVSYVLRVVTITQRTLTTGPFLIYEADQPSRE
jgi:hypothetical protein